MKGKSSIAIILIILIVMLAYNMRNYKNNSFDKGNERYEQAIEKQNPNFCHDIKQNDIKDRCLLDLAIDLEEPLLCSSIKEERALHACKAAMGKLTGDEQFCKFETRDLFYSDICYRNAAITSLDKNICPGIADPDKKIECYTIIAFELKNPEICENMHELPESNCKKKIAIAENNFELCSTIVNAVSKNSCRITIAKLQNNSLLCEQVSIQDMKTSCLEAFR